MAAGFVYWEWKLAKLTRWLDYDDAPFGNRLTGERGAVKPAPQSFRHGFQAACIGVGEGAKCAPLDAPPAVEQLQDAPHLLSRHCRSRRGLIKQSAE
jgi:hypothetical protein